VRRAWLLLAAVSLAWAADPPAGQPEEPAPNSDASCLECHSDDTLTMKKQGVKLSLFVNPRPLAQSAHKSLNCIDCHEDYDGEATPHHKPMVPVDCFSCHDDTAKKHGFHNRMLKTPRPNGEDTACVSCHGKHDVAAVKASTFPFTSRVQADACGKCHETARDHFTQSAHGRAFAERQPNSPDCLTCHRSAIVPAKNTLPSLQQKLVQTKQCESCHVEKESVANQALRGTKFVTSFDQSVHGSALHNGDVGAANCVDCHGAHEMNRAMAASAKVNKQHVTETCARCHEEPANEFADSVHAAALRKGNLDSPACTDCHGEHDIRGHKDPTSPVHASNVAQQVCADCHDSLKLTAKYGIASHSFQTFADSYHGLAVRGGAVEVVNCASCHSSHGIKSEEDPTSTIHKANLAQTCGQCHPGANTRFAVGKVHVQPEAASGTAGNSPVLYLISSLYVALIVAVIGGMVLHNLLDFIKKIRRKLAIQKGIIAEEHVAHRLHLRMSVHERLQHGALVLSFGALVVTGFMLLAGAWHFWYLAATVRGRQLFRDLLPRWRDVTDPFRVLRYNLGLAPAKPLFGRFSYIEKAEYWAMMWGTLLMGITGVILWFDNTSMGLFTKLGFDISRTIHFYEAILATLAIVVWHFYFVIFNPDIYPMNLAWLTGRMSEKEMLEEHPLELEAKAGETKPAAPIPPASRP
jgi:cytochrome b subunit of formate dehydrogenase